MTLENKKKYPAKENARRVKQWILNKGGKEDGMLYLEAQKQVKFEDNDQEAPFRQRRYFFYLSGCELPDSFVIYSLKTDKLVLFIPPIDAEDVIWSGLPMSPTEALDKYDVDEVFTADHLDPFLAESQKHTPLIYVIKNQILDTLNLTFQDQDLDLLKQAIEESRVQKSTYELALMTYANEVSSEAHMTVMKAAKWASNERELEALFLKRCMEKGLREQAYHSIFASGTSSATLHYIKNNASLDGKLNILVDAGAEHDCYASDITRTWPLNGKFTEESKDIYELTLKMQLECIDMIKPEAIWDDIHTHAHKVLIEGFLKLGIFKGDAEEILEARTSVAFFPHGLGHYLGMDTHDTGGNPNYNDKDSMFRYLRKRGPLDERSVITVEPGIYFFRFMIDPYLKNPEHIKFINTDVLDKYWEIGGVRIEDNVVVVENGHLNLTKVPKTVEDIEALMAEE